MIVAGLSWWQAWLCVWIGYTIAGAFVVISGRIGAVYHISFPVVGRASFGIWGSLWPVFNRAAMGECAFIPDSIPFSFGLTHALQPVSGTVCRHTSAATASTS